MYIYQHIEDNTKYYIDSIKNISQIFIQYRYRVNKNIKSCTLFITILKNMVFKFNSIRYTSIYLNISKETVTKYNTINKL